MDKIEPFDIGVLIICAICLVVAVICFVQLRAIEKRENSEKP